VAGNGEAAGMIGAPEEKVFFGVRRSCGGKSWLDAAIPNGGFPALQGGFFLKLWARWEKKESRHAYRYPSLAKAGGNVRCFREDTRCTIHGNTIRDNSGKESREKNNKGKE